MRRLLTGLGPLALIVACAAESSATSCSSAADCTSSREAQELGRCAPQDAVCHRGQCRVECLGLCSYNELADNLCPRGGICDQPAVPRAGAAADHACTKGVVRCTAPTDCPAYRPTAGEWTCDQAGICRFPGFTYTYD